MKRDLTQAERTAISRRQIQRLEVEAEARRKAEEKAALERHRQTLLRQKEREAERQQRAKEQAAFNAKKAAQRKQILGR
jgi:hypothetical protein